MADDPNLLVNSITHSDRARTIIDTENKARTIKVEEDGRIGVTNSFPNLLPADYYLYKTKVTPVLTATASIADEVVNVVSSTGVVVGHAITFYEGNNMFQSLVTGTTPTTISLASPIDFEYTEAALVEAGIWSMNVDGSGTTQVFSIKAPPTASISIHEISCSMLDASDMDDGLFGGMPALTAGLLFRFTNILTKNLAVIVNNLGFWEIGFELAYSDKAPAGQYGLRLRRNIPVVNGVSLTLDSGGDSEFQMHVRDDQRALDLFSSTIHGHMVDGINET